MNAESAPSDGTPVPSTSGNETEKLHVELRRYLAGVPFSHRREMTAEERGAIARHVRRYWLAGIPSLALVLVSFLVDFSDRALEVLLNIYSFIFVPIAFSCCYWLLPFLSAMRKGEVDVYIGPMRNLREFDAAQDYYLKQRGFDANLDRYIEVLAVGDGDRIWRIEGKENDEELAGVKSVYVAVVPDIDEQGERALTVEESEELLLRAREYRSLGRSTPAMGLALIVATIFAVVAFIFAESVTRRATAMAVAIFFFLFCTALVGEGAALVERHRFARGLIDDLASGVVRDGHLASGLPWVVDGEPAHWRVGWSRKIRKVTRAGAKSLDARGPR